MKTLRLIFAPMLILLFVCAGLSFAQSMEPISSKDEVVATNVKADEIFPPTEYNGAPRPSDAFKTNAQWSTGAKIPVPKAHYAVASIGNDVYFFSGLTLVNNVSTYDNKCYKYNTTTNTWTQLANFPLSSYLYAHAEVVNGKIYITGGVTNTNPFTISLTCYEYNPATNTFTRKANMLTSQTNGSTAVLNNKIYYIGGRTIQNNALVWTGKVQVYDAIFDRWSTNTSYPRAVGYTGCATVQNKIIMTGGYNNTFSPITYIMDTNVGELTDTTLSWRKVSNYPIGACILLSGIGVGSKAYFFGGRPGGGTYGNPAATALGFSYEPANDSWKQMEFKPTEYAYQPQVGTDGSVIVAAGGVDITGAILDVNEIYNTASSAAPVAKVIFQMPDALTSQIFRFIKTGTTSTAQLLFTNLGGADLTWQLAVDAAAANYLKLQSTSGSTKIGDTAKVTITIDGKQLTAGSKSTSLTLTTNDPTKSSITIPVSIIVADEVKSMARRILVEEYTGTWCPWCPDGATVLEGLVSTYGEKLSVLSYHGGSSTEPLQTVEGNKVISGLKVQIYPSATFDRVLLPTNYQGGLNVDRSRWEESITLRLAEASTVSLRVKNYSYNVTSKQVEGDVDVEFLQGTNLPIRLSAVMIESGANYGQQSNTGLIYPYTHKHVVKQMLPDAFGVEVNVATNLLGADAKITKHISFKSVDSVVANSELVVFAHISDGKVFSHVLQSAEIPLSGQGLAVKPVFSPEEIGLTNYPNPFGSSMQPMTGIQFTLPQRADVKLVVIDALGRTVATLIDAEKDAGAHFTNFDGASLTSGVYYVRLTTGATSIAKRMLVVR